MTPSTYQTIGVSLITLGIGIMSIPAAMIFVGILFIVTSNN